MLKFVLCCVFLVGIALAQQQPLGYNSTACGNNGCAENGDGPVNSSSSTPYYALFYFVPFSVFFILNLFLTPFRFVLMEGNGLDAPFDCTTYFP